MEIKVRMRVELLAARSARPVEARAAAGLALARHALAAWSGVGSVAAYASFGTEPPTRPMLDALAAAGVDVLLPVVTGDALDWAAYRPEAMVPGELGIPEPAGARLGAGAVAHCEVVVVPALAVDRAGHRLGRGRGYYDRALAAVTAPVVAVGYDEELVEAVPVEPHDRSVDGMLRPAGLRWLTRG